MVPDVVRVELPVLLAARLRGVVGVVFGPHHKHVFVVGCAAEQVGHVEGERGLAADVPAHGNAVEPHPRRVVDGTEVDQGEPTGHGAEVALGDGAAVPDHGVEAGVGDPRRGRLRRERHPDLAVETTATGRVVPALTQPAVPVVVGELPQAVQDGPARPDQLRARVVAVLL